MWSDKHKPTTWQHFIGNSGAVQRCKDWLRDFQSGKPGAPRALIISGPEGCGKSLAAELLLKKQGYHVYAFGVKDIKNHKRDKNSLDNFCNLYQTDLSLLGAKHSRRTGHAIVLEDYEGLTKSDKTFNKIIIDLIRRHPSTTVPLVITSTENCGGKQTSSSGSTGLLKLAKIVTFERLLAKDLVSLAMRVAEAEGVALNQQPAEVLANSAHGDARSLLLAMEMFYIGHGRRVPDASSTAAKRKKTPKYLPQPTDANFFGAPDELERQISEFSSANAAIDTAEKVVKGVEGGITSHQSDDERILGMAIGDRGNKRSDKEQAAALRLVKDNSMQFTPFLFQAYPQCLPKPAGNMSNADAVEMGQKSMAIAAQIADEMSLGDVVRSATWGYDTHYEIFPAIGLELPIRRLRAVDHNNFTVNVNGYQTYYGMENTLSHQRGLVHTLAQLSGVTRDLHTLSLQKYLFGKMLIDKTISDQHIVEQLYPTPPIYLETLAKLKIRDCVCSISKARVKRMTKIFEEIQEKDVAHVKFLDEMQESDVPEHFRRKRQRITEGTEGTEGAERTKGSTPDKNDVFALGWD